jgi:SAM-dependent methyltransferase
MDYLPAGCIVEIAPGLGRITEFLKDYTDRLIAIDLNQQCVQACRKRFASFPHCSFEVNDGASLPGVEDRSVDLVFSWDSLVHAQLDAIEPYLHECARVLKPGGVAFIHHSNLAELLARSEDPDRFREKWGQGRADQVDRAVGQRLCEAAGLQVPAQEVVPWGHPLLTDCLSLFTLERTVEGPPLRVENHAFRNERRLARAVSLLYGRDRSPDPKAEIRSLLSLSPLQEAFRWIPQDEMLNCIPLSELLRYLVRRIFRR